MQRKSFYFAIYSLCVAHEWVKFNWVQIGFFIHILRLLS
ncbi:hypothetical protein BARBAKC583_0415 [Bartonella bacilliformis KC583]|uniref:Uncharacterized protein n=1 Tax=Bartonella bacilliformis (strain ATCC 35685 / KC583 / Herrer 020/F12,63) TaxID=360095 RepID=A1URY1_BARBK|nr:hypothetical protein BARBAKC583_0415 [Bartonella bacilliformis KC583]